MYLASVNAKEQTSMAVIVAILPGSYQFSSENVAKILEYLLLTLYLYKMI